jgi:hypothetical protein
VKTYKVTLETRSYSFEAYGHSMKEARLVMSLCLKEHARQLNLPDDWHRGMDFNTQEIIVGVGYRDGELMLRTSDGYSPTGREASSMPASQQFPACSPEVRRIIQAFKTEACCGTAGTQEDQTKYVLREALPDDREDDYEFNALTEKEMAEMLADKLGMKLVPL